MKSTSIPWKALGSSIVAFSSLAFAPAFAEEPVIIVDIKDVVHQVAQNIRAEASQLPLTVQVPLRVAAKVCDVPTSVLSAQGSSGGAVGCAAMKSSPELEKIVRTKLRK